MTLRWVACDHSGYVIASLTSLQPTGPLRRTMGRYESAQFNLILNDTVDPGWIDATEPYAGAVIGFSGDPGAEVVEWGGIVTKRTRAVDSVVTLTAATPECYLDRRFTGDLTRTATEQNAIMTALLTIATVGDARAPGSTGWPFQIVFDGVAGPLRDRTYLDVDDKTLYSAIDELSHVIGGPQWATDWVWQHNPERILPVALIGNRVGAAQTHASTPAAFTTAMMTNGGLGEDYGAGRGANLVKATSTSFEGERPEADAPVTQPNRPVVEDRFTPSTSITTLAVLQAHADDRLATLKDGSRAVAFTVSRGVGPRYGVDWNLGDDVSVTLTGVAFPGPLTLTGQCIGVELTADTVTPYIAGLED